MVLNKDFREFVELLNKHKVRYLVIGGYAVNFHGYPRYTKDIDFWIWLTQENIHKLIKVIDDFGFGTLGLKETDFEDPENIIQLGIEPYRIDLLVDLEGADFEKCYQQRTSVEIDKTHLDILSLDDLIKAKKISGRLQDLADAEQLGKIKKKRKEI